ncbi:hypothetical protein ACXYMX_11860 [Sporosarcina sp. CAU 1771]
MNPSELIYFTGIGVAVVVANAILWFIFKKRKRVAIAVTSILVLAFIGYNLYFPTLKMNKHSEAYETVRHFLDENYPDKEFKIVPEHYEAGYTVGDFDVNDIESPTIGVTLRVEKDEVTEIGYWSNLDYPSQHELWREIQSYYESPYSLNKDLAEITKIDEWIEGELTAFALTIDQALAIAIFNYSKAGYSLLELHKGDLEEFVFIEEEGYLFIYVDELYSEEEIIIRMKNGEEYTLNVAGKKGRLIVEKQ